MNDDMTPSEIRTEFALGLLVGLSGAAVLFALLMLFAWAVAQVVGLAIGLT